QVDSEHWLATTSADDGTYSFSGLPAGPHDVYVGDAGAVSVTFVTRTMVPPYGDLELDLPMPGGRIAGTVTFAGKDPPPPVALLLEGDLPGQRSPKAAGESALNTTWPEKFGFVGKVSAEPDGRFRSEHVADGRYRVTAVAVRGDWGAERRDGVVVVNGAADGPVNLTLSPGGRIRVSVRRATGEPVTGAHVVFSDADGVPA